MIAAIAHYAHEGIHEKELAIESGVFIGAQWELPAELPVELPVFLHANCFCSAA
jgi:hypothetical protein